MRYSGEHAINFNISIYGDISGTLMVTPENAEAKLKHLEGRIHEVLADEFKMDGVCLDIHTDIDADESRLNTREICMAFDRSLPMIFEHWDDEEFEETVGSCVDDINQRLVAMDYRDPRNADDHAIISATFGVLGDTIRKII